MDHLYHPKVFSEKASAIARLRQKCVRNASEMLDEVDCIAVPEVRNASKMRQNGSSLLGKEERSKMRQKCVKNASKMRGTPWGGTSFGRYRDQCQSRGRLLTNFQGHWSIRSFPENKAPTDWSIGISLEIHMDHWPPDPVEL